MADRSLPTHDAARRTLSEALRAHRPDDAAEAASLAEILALVESEPECFSRRCYTPGHVTGSAFIVCAQTGRVLLHHHRRLDRWLQMGGHDEGERDPSKTALREAGEESGLADLVFLAPGILDVDVHAIPASRGEPEHRHHDVRFALTTRTPDAVRRDDAESLDMAWLDLAEAAERMGEPGAVRALRRLGALLPRVGP